jgi:chemotaxis signal transduction protein
MQLPRPAKPPGPRAEQIIVFRIGGQLFAVSSASVQEVRSVDAIAGLAQEIPQSSVHKVQYAVRRPDGLRYLVNGGIHFGLPPSSASLVFFLRNTRIALLIDAIERMTSMTRLQALSHAFCHEEHAWYRGLTLLDQTVVPVVDPNGFLSLEELSLLEKALEAIQAETATAANRESDLP